MPAISCMYRCRTWTLRRAVCAAAAASHLAIIPAAMGGTTEVVTLDANTGLAAGCSELSFGGSPGRSVSAGGRYIAFVSQCGNLGPVDGNGRNDVYVRDRRNHVTQRISVGAAGKWSNGNSGRPTMTPDGRFVAFDSDASTLVAGDTNGRSDVFVRDRLTGHTERVSISTNGTQGDDSSFNPSISADGRYVAFDSRATTLAPGATTRVQKIFVRDRLGGTTRWVSVPVPGAQLSLGDDSDRPSISGDARYIAFESFSNDLVPNDTNSRSDIFVRDLLTQTTERVTTGTQGEANGASYVPSISADGRYVAFESDATNLVGKSAGYSNAIVHDRQTGGNELISIGIGGVHPDSGSFNPVITADGRYVAFYSFAANLVPGDTNGQMDVFLRDRQQGVTERISVNSTGQQASGPSGENVAIGANGRFVAFDSWSTDLVPNDKNDSGDVYLRDLGTTYSFTVQPNSISFGDRVVSSSSTKGFSLHNTSSTPLPVLSVDLRGTDKVMFSLAHTCGTSVPAGGTCLIDVTFHPTAVGDFEAQVRVVAGESTVRTRTITGSGVVATP